MLVLYLYYYQMSQSFPVKLDTSCVAFYLSIVLFHDGIEMTSLLHHITCMVVIHSQVKSEKKIKTPNFVPQP